MKRNAPQNVGMNGRQWTRISKGLGWFSLALGASQITMPRRMIQLTGMRNGISVHTMRALGLREIGSGLGILSRPHRPAPVWSRFAGDVMNLVLLGLAVRSFGATRKKLLTTAAAVLGIAALDAHVARRLPRLPRPVRRTVTIDRPREEVYAFHRELQNLPRFMRHLESVQVIDDRRSRWIARLPGGARIQWEAEITEDQINESISWRSIEGSVVHTHGSVRFEEDSAGRGTLLDLEMYFAVPALAGLFADLELASNLTRLKQMMEYARPSGDAPASPT